MPPRDPERRSDEESLAVSGQNIASDFQDAIWDAAGKFSSGDGDKAIAASEESLWAEKDVLNFKDFCASPDHMNFPPLSDRQARVSEYMFGEDPRKLFDTGRHTAVLCWGKGAGKDYISAMMILYTVYVLLCTKNPQQYLRRAPHSNIDLLNVAASKEQAETIFFDIMKTFVLNWKWLKIKYDVQVSGRYFSTSTDKILSSEKRVTITNDSVIFPHNIRAFSGSSEGENLEGKSLLMFVMDEVDAFKVGSQFRNAAKIYRILRTSAFSRFKKRYKCFILSYPRSKDGFILKMYEQCKNMLSVYTDKAATWEVLPASEFSKETFDFEGRQIPMDFYEEFSTDPIGSRRMYMCDAPVAESAFIEDQDKIDEAMAPRTEPPLFEFKDRVKDGFVTKTILKSPYMPDRSIRYILVLDLGIKNNPAALSLMHREQDRVVVDFTTRWIPNEKAKVIVDLTNVEDIINEIFERVTVECMYADHWNSPLFVQRLRKNKGRKAEVVKIDYDDYESFRRMLYAGCISLPRNKDLGNELKNLQEFSGRKVDHPEGGNDDMAVTIVMGTKMLTKVAKSEGSSSLAAEGEYVGENMHEAMDVGEEKPMGMDFGIMIDGVPL